MTTKPFIEKNNRIIVICAGGLGNQLFQYSIGRAISHSLNAQLVLDNWSGFVRDRQYKRKFELKNLSTHGEIASGFEKMAFWAHHLARKSGTLNKLIQKEVYPSDIIYEKEARFMPEIKSIVVKRKTWLLGYWQTGKYFKDIKNTILSECMPTVPTQQTFSDLGLRLRSSTSVAICLRFYEESSTPEAHAFQNRFKTVNEIRKAVERIKIQVSAPRFYVFSAYPIPFFRELHLPKDTVQITHCNGFNGSHERLWLLSNCKHHIFNNSSFYWWGAYLSQKYHGGTQNGQKILVADNFINQDCYEEGWEMF